MTFEIGTIVAGKYRIERLLGQGGMGKVYLATHLLLDRPVTLKLLREHAVCGPLAIERLIREGRALARLRGNHVARVLDVEAPTDGPCYLVLEYLDGEDLARTLRRDGPMPIDLAAAYVVQACEALAEAHASGLIHRDIKPSNLFLTTLSDGSRGIKLIDFGIARSFHSDAELTESHAILGSPRYMAPEQMRANGCVDARCDIWALGVVLYELLTDRRPYGGDSVLEICAEILETTPMRVRDSRADVPAELESAILRCLSRDPAARFSSVAALAHAIAPFSGMSEERLAWTLSRASNTTPAQMPTLGGRDASPIETFDAQTQTEAGLTVAPQRRFSRTRSFTGALAIGFTGMLVAVMLARVDRKTSGMEALSVTTANAPAPETVVTAPSAPTTGEARRTFPLTSNLAAPAAEVVDMPRAVPTTSNSAGSSSAMVDARRSSASQRLARPSSKASRSAPDISAEAPTRASSEATSKRALTDPASSPATDALEGDPVLKFGHY